MCVNSQSDILGSFQHYCQDPTFKPHRSNVESYMFKFHFGGMRTYNTPHKHDLHEAWYMNDLQAIYYYKCYYIIGNGKFQFWVLIGQYSIQVVLK